MNQSSAKAEIPPVPLLKAPSGISGLDEITGGGLPRGRTTLVCGGAGAGKTLFGIEFLVRGATQYGEKGVLVTFEETAEELDQNAHSLGFDLDVLVAQGKLFVDFVRVERSEIEETGEYDLTGLFVRLSHAIDTLGASRVVLDTVETLFAGLGNPSVLRAELRRLFRWLKEKGVTAVVTGERGDQGLTRHGLEEYVSDCVIMLDHRVRDELSTRRLRIVKYRGSDHGTNEYPFLIDESGISVVPITSLRLEHDAPEERISTGIQRLDAMLGGRGLYRGSSVLITGAAGTGKTSVSAHFLDAACRRGERCLWFSFEESPAQLLRNMRSIGLDLVQWDKKGLLHVHSTRATAYGLEMHLARLHKSITEFKPDMVVLDPLTTFTVAGTSTQAELMLTRLIDFLKGQQITAVFTSLTHGGDIDESHIGISSLTDTWISLRDIEEAGERNRSLYVLKSRGMAHSNQVREFILTDGGIQLVDVYTGPGGVLTGSARLAQEMREQENVRTRQQQTERTRRKLNRQQQALKAQVASLIAEEAANAEELALLEAQEGTEARVDEAVRERLREKRGVEGAAGNGMPRGRKRPSPTGARK